MSFVVAAPTATEEKIDLGRPGKAIDPVVTPPSTQNNIT